jgi:hypothetical protein
VRPAGGIGRLARAGPDGCRRPAPARAGTRHRRHPPAPGPAGGARWRRGAVLPTARRCGGPGAGRRRGGGTRRRCGRRGGVGSRLGRAAGQRHARPAARPAGWRRRARGPGAPRPPHRRARALRIAAQWQARDAQPGWAAFGGWAVGARSRPRVRRHAPGARPRRGVPGATRGAHPGCAGHRAGHRWVRGHLPGAAGHGGFRAGPAGLRRRRAGRGPVRGAGGDRPAPRPLPPRRRSGRRQRRPWERWRRGRRHGALASRAGRRRPRPAVRRGAAVACHDR